MFFSLGLAFERRAYAYVDPGSGLLMLQAAGTVFTGVLFTLRKRIKALITRNKPADIASHRGHQTRIRKPDLLRPFRNALPDRAANLAKAAGTNPVRSHGLHHVFLLWVVKPAVEPNRKRFYHWSGPARNFFCPSRSTSSPSGCRRCPSAARSATPGRLRVAIWAACFSSPPGSLVRPSTSSISLDHSPAGPPSLSHACSRHYPPHYAALASLLRRPLRTCHLRSQHHPRLRRYLRHSVTLPARLSRMASESLDGQVPLPQRPPTTIQPHRIIWIVFDELSYQQTFEHRFPGLKLPAFDALASHPTASPTPPPFDIYTEVVLPGLFAGKPFDHMQITPASRALCPQRSSPASGRPSTARHRLSGRSRSGYSTAVAGWYNPYCRILPAVLDSCYWSYRSPSNLMLPSEYRAGQPLAAAKAVRLAIH